MLIYAVIPNMETQYVNNILRNVPANNKIPIR